MFEMYFGQDSGQQGGDLPSRSDIDASAQWNLSDIFQSDNDWETEFTSITELLPDVQKFKGTLGSSADRLYSWFQLSDDLNVRIGKLGNYAARKYDEDTSLDKYQGMLDRVMSLYARIGAETSWVRPELLSIDKPAYDGFLASHQGLQQYAHSIDDLLRMKQYTLTDSEERILALSRESTAAPGNIFGMFNDADIRFGSIEDADGKQVEVTKGRFLHFQESRNRRVREDSFKALYTEYHKWRNSVASMLAHNVKSEIFYARSRGYESTLAAALHSDNIPTKVYDTVIKGINDEIRPMQEYISLRKNMLQVESLKPWDMYVPLIEGDDRTFEFTEAKDMVLDSLAPLGEEYLTAARKAFTDGWIDIYENRGKASGAYSAWTYGAHPYILLNYTGTLKEVFTLAHELGHAMHSYFTWKNQPPTYGGYTIFCAEVASTCNEILLLDYLLKTSTDEEFKKELLLHSIDTIRGTVYNQVLFSEFEQRIHSDSEKGIPLTADYFSAAMSELYGKYYGSDFEMDDLYAMNWSRIPHFYRSFYVYQYATGFAAASTLANSILANESGAVDRYLRYLKSGNSDYSVNLLRSAGVDMETAKPVEDVTSLLSQLIGQFKGMVV
ncbi:MAG: oligoendopeptidase F [Ectothiorhodospiraceae bacterium]|nr:oligoendopeptidase F [Ectothiorhodospiraceae bacterium]